MANRQPTRQQYKHRRCVVCGNFNPVTATACKQCRVPIGTAVKTAEKSPARRQLDRERHREQREFLEARLDQQMRARKLPEAQKDYRFHATRGWRFDRAYPDIKLAIEVEGGLRKRGEDGKQGGRHNRADGYIEDCRKYTEAAVLGWRIVRVTVASLKDNSAVDAIEKILAEAAADLLAPRNSCLLQDPERHTDYLRSLINS